MKNWIRLQSYLRWTIASLPRCSNPHVALLRTGSAPRVASHSPQHSGLQKKPVRQALSHLFCAILLLGFATPLHADDEEDGTGLPVPRFVSLRSGDINMRVGPGTRYSINWVYKREGLPVEIIQEFEQWREIRDSEGTVGWVHKQMLQGRRNIVVKARIGVLRRTPDLHGAPMLRAEQGVIGRLLECDKDWCRVQVSGRKGWMVKREIWGVYAKEEF